MRKYEKANDGNCEGERIVITDALGGPQKCWNRNGGYCPNITEPEKDNAVMILWNGEKIQLNINNRA